MNDRNRSGFGDDMSSRKPSSDAAGALDGHDDPNRGPLDRAANAVTGGTGGVSGAMRHDDPSRGPLDRTANAVSGESGGFFGTTSDRSSTAAGSTVSAMFDSETEAQRAVSDLRSAGVDDQALSVIARSNGTTTARDVEGTVTDESHEKHRTRHLGRGAPLELGSRWPLWPSPVSAPWSPQAPLPRPRCLERWQSVQQRALLPGRSTRR